jgi:hypothetical protein
MAEAMAEVRIEAPSAPASFKQRLGIGMAMMATAFPHGLNEDEARGFLNRLFSDEEGYREQAVADLTGLIKSKLSKQAEEKDMNHGDEGSEVSGPRQSQRRDENRRDSDRDHRWPGRSGERRPRPHGRGRRRSSRARRSQPAHRPRLVGVGPLATGTHRGSPVDREASAGRADHGYRRARDSVFYLDVRGDS